MEESQPFVSVLITAYNREKYIAEAIESVLASTYSNFELIIADDCSSDNTLDIARSFLEKDNRIKVYSNDINLGQFANRNKAASYARGVYIKYLDSDDTISTNGLEVMIKAMQQFPDCGLGSYTNNEKQSAFKYSSRMAYINHYYKADPLLYVGPSGAIFKTEIFKAAGGFEENIGILADTFLMLKMASLAPVAVFQNNLFYWRSHNEQVTAGQKQYYEMIRQRFHINTKVLNLPALPFTKAEAEITLRNLKSIMIRNLCKNFLNNRSLKKTVEVVRFAKISIKDVLNALLPNKKING